MNYFAFIDETGTNSQDRFFGIGLLTVPEVGELYDKLRPMSDLIRDIARENKHQRIDTLLSEGKIEEIVSLAKGAKTFELKFDRISTTNSGLFVKLIREYFSVKDARFTAIIIDKNNPTFKPTKVFPGTWDAYITFSSIALMRECRNINPSTLVAILDEISKEKGIVDTLESEVKRKFHESCIKKGISGTKIMCSRAESNSHILVQLVDILLGAVSFDYKKRNKLLTPGLISRRDAVVNEIAAQLKRPDLKGDFTIKSPNYFSVWEMNWK